MQSLNEMEVFFLSQKMLLSSLEQGTRTRTTEVELLSDQKKQEVVLEKLPSGFVTA